MKYDVQYTFINKYITYTYTVYEISSLLDGKVFEYVSLDSRKTKLLDSEKNCYEIEPLI